MARVSLPRSGARASSPGAEPSVAGHPGARPRWWAELSLIAVCYVAYSFVRNLVPTDHAAAVGRAYEILKAEEALRLDIEYWLNQIFVNHPWLGVSANYYYSTLHFIVTIGVLVWLYARHPERYATYRMILFATTLIALIGFYSYPLAPPRMLPGFIDTVIEFNTWGLYDSSPVATVSNQYAAMPSLHTAWSIWCALAILAVVRRGWIRILAVGYPAVTVVVIMGTANHFILDAVGGVAVLAAGHAFAHGAIRALGYTVQVCRDAA
jgi:PAP2 superfamily protein